MNYLLTRLGITYTTDCTTFRLWAPTRNSVDLILYENDKTVTRKSVAMSKDEDGVFSVNINDNLDGMFYRYLLDSIIEVTDPYSVSSSVNSEMSAIVDLVSTDPEGFRTHIRPDNKPEEAIIYEVHVKDFTFHKSSGVENRGKFLGFIQDNNGNSTVTGIKHLIDLGVTHVHLLPVYDFNSVNEEEEMFNDINNYNWGYDPELYNTPEGSYSIDPKDPKGRVRELKTLVMKLHEAGISVIIDVVYNHTAKSWDSNFNSIYPMYYHRSFDGVHFSNGSGCGNEIASEKEMVRKFIIDSVKYWQDEYKIDGFRFDLMALTDRTTMELVRDTLREIDDNILIYGEPWAAQGSALDQSQMMTVGSQKNSNIGIFNPNFRDALKGEGDGNRKGYLQGNITLKINMEEGISGSIGLRKPYSICAEPRESINYFNSHDNLILPDKLKLTLGDRSQNEELSVLATNIIMTSQGIPFIHAGNEFFRDKKLDHNSYRSSTDINAIDWNYKNVYARDYKLTRDIIHFRREYIDYFNMDSHTVRKNLAFIDNLPGDIIGYTIKGPKGTIIILHSIKWFKTEINIDHLLNIDQSYKILFDKEGRTNNLHMEGEDLTLQPISTTIIEII